jgi:HK97 family phage portal protein
MPLLPYIYKENWKYVDESNSLYNLLNVQANPIIGAYMFKKLIVTNLLLKGNCYILITKDNNNRKKRLDILVTDSVVPVIMAGQLKYEEKITGTIYDASEIIHILNYTSDGLIGQSTLANAATSLGIAYDSEQHSGNFFKSGGALQGILSPKADAQIGAQRAAAAKAAFIGTNNAAVYGVSTNNVVVMENGMEYQPISISPAESQLLESRQFNVIDICRFFNVPPSLAFSETGKFSTAEQQQIDYLNNCLAPLIEKIENEMFRKLYLPSEWSETELRFDVENLLRLDASSKANYLTQLFNVGGLTTNEIREKTNAKNPVKGGNRAFIQVNLQPTDALISEQQVVNPVAKIDNQLKNNNNEDGE